jgi:DEAD/DEAH box helicase domain-containing protein
MIDEPWFAGSSGEAPANREAFGRALIRVLSRERSISPQDIDFASTKIAVLTEQGPKRVTNCVAVHDVVYGGIRLTEDIFDRFQEYLGQISRASALAGSDAIVTKELAAKIEAWASTLEMKPTSARRLSYPTAGTRSTGPAASLRFITMGNWFRASSWRQSYLIFSATAHCFFITHTN